MIGMGLEHTLQSAILLYLNKIPGCKAENVSGNANQSGRPDITGCYKGRMFKIELKTPDNKNTPSRKQDLELKRWSRSGCITGVIYSLKTMKEALNLMDTISNSTLEYSWTEAKDCVSWLIIPPMKGA